MLNETIKKMTEHTSVRDYKKQDLTESEKEALMSALQSGSTSNHIQAFSVIEVKDQALREELMKVTGNPYVKDAASFYVFVADLYRESVILERAGKGLEGLQNIEALMVAIVDTTIAAQNFAVAAESMDLGICYIGGIRNNVRRVAELLKLPKYTLPLVGMCVGLPASKNERKPRLPLRNQVSRDSYDSAAFTDLTDFDETMKNYYASRSSHQKDSTWTEMMVDYLKEERRADIGAFLKDQGFKL